MTSALKLFGEAFTAGYVALVILVTAELVNAGTGSVGSQTSMTGHQWTGALVRGVGAALNVALNLLLIPRFGIECAAAATVTTLILWNVWLHGVCSRRLGVRPSIVFAFGNRQ